MTLPLLPVLLPSLIVGLLVSLLVVRLVIQRRPVLLSPRAFFWWGALPTAPAVLAPLVFVVAMLVEHFDFFLLGFLVAYLAYVAFLAHFGWTGTTAIVLGLPSEEVYQRLRLVLAETDPGYREGLHLARMEDWFAALRVLPGRFGVSIKAMSKSDRARLERLVQALRPRIAVEPSELPRRELIHMSVGAAALLYFSIEAFVLLLA